MLVAISILALSLGVLYEAVSGAENARVPVSGTHSRGETAGGFSWYVAAAPMRVAKLNLNDGALQEIEVAVSWQDGRKRRRVVLHSIVEGYRP
jgi:general secretion pathway protein I